MLRRLNLTLLLAPLLLASSACPAGRGDGWVIGSLSVRACRGDKGLDRGAGQYDLGANFFAGDPLLDFSGVNAVRRSSLTVRIQDTTLRIEEADGLMLTFNDTVRAANAYARGEGLSVKECLGRADCWMDDAILRAQLSLYSTCPQNRSALVASARPVVERHHADRVERCLIPQPFPTRDVPESCRQMSAQERAELDTICAGDFNDRGSAEAIRRILGKAVPGQRAACLYLCAMGKAARGDDKAALADFQFDYGDRIAGLFFFSMVDSRAAYQRTCSNASAELLGTFDFKMVRSRAAQAFP